MKNKFTDEVLIIGGGPSGLSAAHELAEKGLRVTVLEAAPFVGGKPISAHSYPYKPPPKNKNQLAKYLASSPSLDNSVMKLPIEHGFRVYPENYHNLMSIFERIESSTGIKIKNQLTNVLNLAPYHEKIHRNRKKRHRILAYLEKIYFGLGIYLPYILCNQRALKYDEVSISEHFKISKRSPELADLILRLTDSLSSGMLDRASSLAVMNILMNYYYATGRTGFRTFDRPTHIAWLNPWEQHLRHLGVVIHKNCRVIKLILSGANEIHTKDHTVHIKEVVAIENGKEKVYPVKNLIVALPIDALIKILNQNYEILRYDSRLLDLYKVTTLPATGVQLYYERPIDEIAKQLFAGSMVNHPWGISYVDQTMYWHDSSKYAGQYGIISIYVSVTNHVGRYVKKSLQNCTANEIAYEMFSEVESELRKRGIVIPKRIGYFSHSYQNEPHASHGDKNTIVTHQYNGACDEDMLHLCVTGMRKWRPLPETVYLNNMVLCGAYTRNDTYHVSTMESACESGRRAANTLLKKFKLAPITIYTITPPRHIQILRSTDQWLYRFWLPNPLEIIFKILGNTLNTKHIHMNESIREYENLHW